MTSNSKDSDKVTCGSFMCDMKTVAVQVSEKAGGQANSLKNPVFSFWRELRRDFMRLSFSFIRAYYVEHIAKNQDSLA
jgi:hypothetical protein